MKFIKYKDKARVNLERVTSYDSFTPFDVRNFDDNKKIEDYSNYPSITFNFGKETWLNWTFESIGEFKVALKWVDGFAVNHTYMDEPKKDF